MSERTKNSASELTQEYFENQIESLLIDQRRIVLRERAPGKYDSLQLALYLQSNFNPFPKVGEGFFPGVEPSYYLGRWHNDSADGKTPVPYPYANYSELAARQKEILDPDFNLENIPTGLTIDFLLKRAITKLERVQKPGDNIRQDLSQFMDSMLIEHHRRSNHSVFSSEDLRDLYDMSFGRPHNIMLIAMESKNRAEEISLLSQIQGPMFNSERKSLHEDLKLGICYIPAEVLYVSGLSVEELVAQPGLVDVNKALITLRENEVRSCKEMYKDLTKNIRHLDWKAKLYVKSLTKNMKSVFESVI